MLVFFIAALLWTVSSDYVPVVFLHGFYMAPEDLKIAVDAIQQGHPGTKVFALDFYDTTESACSLCVQVPAVIKKIEALNLEKFHLIGFSQGGPIARGVVEFWPDPSSFPIQKLISLAGPQLGFYGPMPWFMVPFLPPQWVDQPASERHFDFYLPSAQLNQTFGSICNLWHDPNIPEEQFVAENLFFGALNVPDYEEKLNFLKLREAHFFGSPEDGIVEPWASSVFGFYAANSTSREGVGGKIVWMESQKVYKTDSFGLQSMDKRGDLHIRPIASVPHMDWIKNEMLFQSLVLPLLD